MVFFFFLAFSNMSYRDGQTSVPDKEQWEQYQMFLKFQHMMKGGSTPPGFNPPTPQAASVTPPTPPVVMPQQPVTPSSGPGAQHQIYTPPPSIRHNATTTFSCDDTTYSGAYTINVTL